MGYLAKHLSAFGWEPTILTRRAPHANGSEKNIIRVGGAFRVRIPATAEAERKPYTALSPLKACVRDVVFFPDRAAHWIPFATAAGLSAHNRRPFDAILSSAMPASAHVAAFLLASLLKIPWLADYRDLWTGNPYIDDPSWKKDFAVRLERRILRKAAAITTITPALAAALETFHARPVRAISNAVDIDEWNDVPFGSPNGFRIVHAGSLYDGRRSPARLFSQIAALRRKGELRDVAIDFYGPNPGNLLELSQRYDLGDAVKYHGVVERREAMRAERAAALLVIIQNDDPQTASEYGSKIFEYQAAGPRILVCGPQAGVLRGYVQEHQLGWYASGDEELRESLRAAYRLYAEGDVVRQSFQSGTVRVLAEEFAATLDEMLASHVPEPRSAGATGFEKKESAILR
ncbi:MAG: glycosyltransferase [Vulcanimicrobiaceae bacterium]